MSYLAVRDILVSDKQLRDYQQEDLVKCLITKRAVISYETGMGKTTLASAIIRALVNEVPNRRFIFVITNNQLDQTVKEVAQDTGLKVETCSGKRADQYRLLIKKDVTDYQILFITLEFFDTIEAVWYLYKHASWFHGIFIDEAHLMSNFRSSSRAFALRGLLSSFEIRYALTATPSTSDLKQSVNLFHMLFPDKLWDLDDLVSRMRYKKTSLEEEFPNFYLNRSKGDLILNYKANPHYIRPLVHQMGAKGYDAYLTLKGPGAENCLEKLKEIIDGHLEVGRKGLVYIEHREVMAWIVERLRADGYKLDFLNGEITNRDERSRRVASYNSDEVDILITSITESLNLEADFLVLYESCPDLIQFFGRGHRSMNPKTLHLEFMFVEDSIELVYFTEKVYPRYVELQYALSKDYSVIVDMARKVNARKT